MQKSHDTTTAQKRYKHFNLFSSSHELQYFLDRVYSSIELNWIESTNWKKRGFMTAGLQANSQ